MLFDKQACAGSVHTNVSKAHLNVSSHHSKSPFPVRYEPSSRLVPALASLPLSSYLFSQNVATLRLFPGITAAIVRAFLTPPVKGVVLETFGAGNAPQRNDLMTALKEACDSGVVIVAISQCAKGSVSAAYEAGRTLLNAGVVSGGDMTPEVSLSHW